jgi:hypothetical protein
MPSAIERDGIRVTVTLVIEMTGDEARAYAKRHNLPRRTMIVTSPPPLRAADVVPNVRARTLMHAQSAFHGQAAVKLK